LAGRAVRPRTWSAIEWLTMNRCTRLTLLFLAVCAFRNCALGDEAPAVLPNTTPLEWTDDLAVRIVEEAHQFLDGRTAAAPDTRARLWRHAGAAPSDSVRAPADHRQRLMKILGVVDGRLPVEMERYGNDAWPALVTETDRYRIWQVRWPVLEGVTGEGLLVETTQRPVADVVAIPDADQTPEQLTGLAPGIPCVSQFARGLAESGCRVLVPMLISRGCEFSGDPLRRMTNQPHREWIYRQAFPLGRHVIGYDIQKVLAAADWLRATGGGRRIGLAGYGEGGLVALYAAALDPRIDACLVSGYFGDRSGLWSEPIERNVWCLLKEFGDAEVASLIAPRFLTIEHCAVPDVQGPPTVLPGRTASAAPGRLTSPSDAAVAKEIARFRQLTDDAQDCLHVYPDLDSGDDAAGADLGVARRGFGSEAALLDFVHHLGGSAYAVCASPPLDGRRGYSALARQQRQVMELSGYLQRLRRDLDASRETVMLRSVPGQDATAFIASNRGRRETLRRDIIGAVDEPLVAPNPRSRLIYDEPTWTGYEVVLDVWPALHAWGILCVPKNLAGGEKRPVVVCQHGLEGVPRDVVDRQADGYAYYHAFAAQLAERGFVTFAPFHLYRGGERFRLLQRKAHPLGLSLYSFIIPQHEQLLSWLGSLPFVDATRIGFYGLSYGGRSALLVPTSLEGYALSICSGNFNDWIGKLIEPRFAGSYLYTAEWEMFEFDLGDALNHAELAGLMFPRPFMVERGHDDGVGLDWWVASEFAKVRWLYDHFDRRDCCAIEYFAGQHEIHGQGTFDFLQRHLEGSRQIR
jgi:dienelactone hydrolase